MSAYSSSFTVALPFDRVTGASISPTKITLEETMMAQDEVILTMAGDIITGTGETINLAVLLT